MPPLIRKTFGGLSAAYYVRNLLFALIFLIFFILIFSRSSQPAPIGAMVFLVVSTLLYPYARFVYESIAGFVMGNNVFFVNAIVMLFVKLFTMAMCWAFAIFIAPVGLAWLYWHHSKPA